LFNEPEVPDEIVSNELNKPSVERNEIQEIIEELKKKCMYIKYIINTEIIYTTYLIIKRYSERLKFQTSKHSQEK